MVYRGKPSAGCENCRKAKKRCGLEQPACARCVKLKKPCSGYRDITQLQIQDESEAVKLKAERHKSKPLTSSFNAPSTTRIHDGLATPAYASAKTPRSDCSGARNETIELPILARSAETIKANEPGYNSQSVQDHDQKALTYARDFVIPTTLQPNGAQVGATYFFSQFTSDNGHWKFLREYERSARVDPLLDLAIKACGVAALDNVRGLVKGREHSRSLYAQALAMLNAALRDPKRCRSDENLISVSMLSYFENLTCDSPESVISWKAHVSGAAQLLRIRGKRQFDSPNGRMLFRETRAQILIACMWDDLEPPSFLWDWNGELASRSDNLELIEPADKLSLICHDFARLRYQLKARKISVVEGFQAANDVEMRMIQWSINTMNGHSSWRYHALQVSESPHVWDGVVHAYEGHPAASVWDTYRNVRIMVTQSQELLCRLLRLPPGQEIAQISYLKSVRRQMTDDICYAIPCQLGHASPAYNSPNIMVTAYGSIWPLFFAGTCALAMVDPGTWTTTLKQDPPKVSTATASALSQTLWIIGRLDYITKVVGLKWADSAAAILRGNFELHQIVLPEYEGADSKFVMAFWEQKLAELKRNELPDWIKMPHGFGGRSRILMDDRTGESAK